MLIKKEYLNFKMFFFGFLGGILYKYSDELRKLDKEFKKYHKRYEKPSFIVSIKLIKRVRSGIPITDKELFIDLEGVDLYTFMKWLNNNSLFSWFIFNGVKKVQNQLNTVRLYMNFHEEKKKYQELD